MASETTYEKSPYYKDRDYDYVGRDERVIYVFEQESNGLLYQGKIMIPEDTKSKAAHDWKFTVYKKIQTPLHPVAYKERDVEEIEETPLWFQEIAKPIRLKKLFQ